MSAWPSKYLNKTPEESPSRETRSDKILKPTGYVMHHQFNIQQL